MASMFLKFVFSRRCRGKSTTLTVAIFCQFNANGPLLVHGALHHKYLVLDFEHPFHIFRHYETVQNSHF